VGQEIGPTLGEGSLRAEVLGTWRRVDLVTVSAVRGQLESSCSCSAGRFCRHAAALLLHWLREPQSFTVAAEPTETEEDSDAVEASQEESPVAELARLLNSYSTAELRTLARRRGARVVAKNKSEMVQQLAPVLTKPESVDAALAGLSVEERIALDGADLLGAADRAAADSVVSAYAALDGAEGAAQRTGEMLNALVDLGLLVREARQVYPTTVYTVPRAVCARLPTRDDLVHVLGADQGAAGHGEVSLSPRLSMIQTFQVIAHELTEGGMQAQPAELTEAELTHLPPGWRIHPKERAERQPYYGHQECRITPLPPLLKSSDLHRLGELTGQSSRMIAFALSLMASMGLLQIAGNVRGYTLLIREDQLWRLLALPAEEQLDLMVHAWLAMPDSVELGMVIHEDGTLHLRFKPTYWSAQEPRGALVRRFVAHLVGRLARGDRSEWYNFSSLLDFLWRLVPQLLSAEAEHPTHLAWRFTEGRQSDRPLNLSVREDWQRVWSPLAGIILAGPMTWLGLVETATARDDTQRVPGALAHDPCAFQVRAAAAILAGREVETYVPALDDRQSRLSVSADSEDGTPLVRLPSGAVDPSIHALLPRLGELAGASTEGLLYRMTADRIQMAFDDGMTGPQLLELLAAHSATTLPDEVRTTIEEWWSGYGRIRLYDDLTLIELGDDLLLRELSATTSIEGALIHVFSPRLIAVDPAMVEDLLAELTRSGHTPRVVEEP